MSKPTSLPSTAFTFTFSTSSSSTSFPSGKSLPCTASTFTFSTSSSSSSTSFPSGKYFPSTASTFTLSTSSSSSSTSFPSGKSLPCTASAFTFSTSSSSSSTSFPSGKSLPCTASAFNFSTSSSSSSTSFPSGKSLPSTASTFTFSTSSSSSSTSSSSGKYFPSTASTFTLSTSSSSSSSTSSPSGKSLPTTSTFTLSTSSSSSSASSPAGHYGNLKFSGVDSKNFQFSKQSAPASAHNTTAPSSSFSFKVPSVFEKADEKENSKETTCDNGTSENAKTKFTVLSSVTGTIPVQFEGSTYSSVPQPSESSCFATGTEEAIKKESDENSVQNPSASQIIVHRLMKGIPQSPHFWPLRGYSEAAKKSLINSWDRIFEETVDQIQSLRLNGLCTDAKRLWDTTQELQMMGYYVVPLRRRLVELSDVVQSRRSHRIEKMRLKGRAMQHMMEKKKLEFEIVKLKAKVEAEKASFEDVMAKVAKMDDEMPSFNDFFSKLAIEPF